MGVYKLGLNGGCAFGFLVFLLIEVVCVCWAVVVIVSLSLVTARSLVGVLRLLAAATSGSGSLSLSLELVWSADTSIFLSVVGFSDSDSSGLVGSLVGLWL